MSRMIDADALLEKMKGTSRYFDVKHDIEEMPIAYDVEKVVEQMADLNTFNLNLADKMLDIQKSGKAHRHYVCVEDAIEIVRSGGVE